MDLYTDAKVKHIIRPQPANIGLCFDEWIDIDSDLWQKECTEQIRRYQSIECSDGFSMDTSDECWKNLQVFPFTSDLFDEELCETRQYLVGAVGFIKYKNDIVVLEFCWLHPFWRNRGLLKKSWCEFSYHFGEFYISKPRTKTMQSLLDSVSYVEPKTIQGI
ncbi:MAG: hypothetical protein ACJAV1_003724 [Paraglaciecola sp.]|jgi:hypothetical protein